MIKTQNLLDPKLIQVRNCSLRSWRRASDKKSTNKSFNFPTRGTKTSTTKRSTMPKRSSTITTTMTATTTSTTTTMATMAAVMARSTTADTTRRVVKFSLYHSKRIQRHMLYIFRCLLVDCWSQKP